LIIGYNKLGANFLGQQLFQYQNDIHFLCVLSSYETQGWKQCEELLVYHITFSLVEFHKTSVVGEIFLSTQAHK